MVSGANEILTHVTQFSLTVRELKPIVEAEKTRNELLIATN